jgi:hypothetical protein
VASWLGMLLPTTKMPVDDGVSNTSGRRRAPYGFTVWVYLGACGS